MATLLHTPAQRNVTTTVRVLLICGVLSSLFYAGQDLLEGLLWKGYSYTGQAFSDYSAIGAPTRPLHLLLTPLYVALVIAFGLGIWWMAGRTLTLCIVGGLMVVYGLVDFVWPQSFLST
jgi:hypothetical protein